MNTEANLHEAKSEYNEAYNVHMRILERNSLEEAPYQHGLALFNATGMDILCGTPSAVVQQKLHTAKSIFSNMNHIRLVIWCDTLQAVLDLREGNSLAANSTFKECLNSAKGKDDEQMAYCLEHLGNVKAWRSATLTSDWTMVFLVHSLKSSQRLAIHKALQFLGNVLFTVALEGFTLMDVHRGRAECMLRLGDLAQERGNSAQAAGFWTDARDVHRVDERLSALEKRPKEALGHLMNLNAPTTSPVDPVIEGIRSSQIIKPENPTQDNGDRAPTVV
ncbi:hypothetical protein DFH09DRAFT_1210649 [Mycena vulgaris]|nr:hypothetical protein DFH09DRAFT_1210649 [Mycena vulgaris]